MIVRLALLLGNESKIPLNEPASREPAALKSITDWRGC